MQLSECAELTVTKPVAEFSEIDEYLVSKLLKVLEQNHDRATSEAARSEARLEQFLADNDITRENMSDDIRSITPWGMLPINLP